jgi:hypothetical protein
LAHERAYLSALAAGAEDEHLRTLARRADDAARAWELADQDATPPPEGIQRYDDAPEIAATLLRDLADAHDRRAQ